MFTCLRSTNKLLHDFTSETTQISQTSTRTLLVCTNWQVELQMAWLKTIEPQRVYELMHSQGSEVVERRDCRCTPPAGRQRSRTSGPSWMTSPFVHISLSRCIYTRSLHTHTHCFLWEADFTLMSRQMTSLGPSIFLIPKAIFLPSYLPFFFFFFVLFGTVK